jgi:hypothetical protein
MKLMICDYCNKNEYKTTLLFCKYGDCTICTECATLAGEGWVEVTGPRRFDDCCFESFKDGLEN